MIYIPSLKIEIWLFGLVGQKKGCSPFKFILHQFSTAISPLTKFHQNRMKNTLVENFCQSVDFNRLSQKVKKKWPQLPSKVIFHLEGHK